MSIHVHCRRREGGLALVMALVLLIGVTVISMAAVSTSLMELRMANNVEGNTNTFQTALAVIDFVIADDANLPTTGPLLQPASVSLSGTPFTVIGNDSIAARAVRLKDCAPPPRARAASSLTAFSAFEYEVSTDVVRLDGGMGRGAMSQGYVVLGPKC